MADPMRTRLNRSWAIKMAVFFVILGALGVWGYYDATIAFPRRGQTYAEFQELDYLRAARDAGQLLTGVSVENPGAELRRLRSPEVTQANARASANENDPRYPVAVFEMVRERWLSALDVIGRLNKEHTTIEDPRARLSELEDGLQGKTAPKPLAAYDIPVQWIFVVVGFGGALWLAGLAVVVSRTRYTWDPESRRLTLPGGASLTPDDLEEVDKRKWHKYLVFLKIKPGHESLGGQQLKLDLLRYSPLERWVLEMEKAAFPEEDKAPTESAGETREDEPGGAPESPSREPTG